MFIGREKELALLQQDYIGKAAMVYGKRRVGKTTLIQKALKSSSYRTVYFECLKGSCLTSCWSGNWTALPETATTVPGIRPS